MTPVGHDMDALGTAVAAELGPSWQLRPNEHFLQGIDLFDTDAGLVLLLRPDLSAQRRVRITGWLPPSDLGLHSPSINVTGTRPAADIAREIRRRLLPEYRDLFVKVREYNADQAEADRRMREATDVLAELYGVGARVQAETHGYRRIRAEYSVHWTGADGSSGELKFERDERTCTLHITRLPVEHARQITELLAALAGR